MSEPLINPNLVSSSEDQYKDLPSRPEKVIHISAPVPIPESFLSTTNPPPDARPVAVTPVDFTSVLPEYEGLYAVVLDNVVSPSECAELLRMVEASVPESRLFERKAGTTRDAGQPEGVFMDPWRPALVSLGGDLEVLMHDYRRGDRIVWDEQEITNRLWARCAQVPGLLDQLAVIRPDSPAHPNHRSRRGVYPPWRFVRINKRLRFLKYRSGDFFRPHCDGPYCESSDEGHRQTLFTLHLYLNDSQAEVGEADASLIGGATSFLSRDGSRSVPVNPRSGRLLIFQHSRLRHSGDDVVAGVKYTVRTDLMYEMVRPGEENGDEKVMAG